MTDTIVLTNVTEDDVYDVARDYDVEVVFGWGGDLTDDQLEVCIEGPDADKFAEQLRAKLG